VDRFRDNFNYLLDIVKVRVGRWQ